MSIGKANEGGGVVVGNDSSRRLPLSKRTVIMLVSGLLVVLIASGLWYAFGRNNGLTDSQKQAVASANASSKKFIKADPAMYDRNRLNQAVVEAGDKHCDSARAIYDEVAKTKTDKDQLARYKTRIDTLCSGKAPTVTHE